MKQYTNDSPNLKFSLHCPPEIGFLLKIEPLWNDVIKNTHLLIMGLASLSHQHKSLSKFFCLVLSDHESNFLKLGEINDNNGSSQQESETSLIGKKEEIP